MEDGHEWWVKLWTVFKWLSWFYWTNTHFNPIILCGKFTHWLSLFNYKRNIFQHLASKKCLSSFKFKIISLFNIKEYFSTFLASKKCLSSFKFKINSFFNIKETFFNTFTSKQKLISFEFKIDSRFSI